MEAKLSARVTRLERSALVLAVAVMLAGVAIIILATGDGGDA